MPNRVSILAVETPAKSSSGLRVVSGNISIGGSSSPWKSFYESNGATCDRSDLD